MGIEIMSAIKVGHRCKKIRNAHWIRPIVHLSWCSVCSRSSKRCYSRRLCKTCHCLQTIPFVLPCLISILQTYHLQTSSAFINQLILSFHTICHGSKFQRFTIYCIKKLFLFSLLNQPTATFIVPLLLLLHDVLNISTFSSSSAFTFCKSSWYLTSDSWVVPVFQFLLRRQLSHHPDHYICPSFVPSLTSVCLSICGSQKRTQCSRCGCTTPFRERQNYVSCLITNTFTMVPSISLAFSTAAAHWAKDFRHLSTQSWGFLPEL